MSQQEAEFEAIRALIAEHGPRVAERILASRGGAAIRVVRCPARAAAQPCTLNDYTAQPGTAHLSTATGGTRARRTATEGWFR